MKQSTGIFRPAGESPHSLKAGVWSSKAFRRSFNLPASSPIRSIRQKRRTQQVSGIQNDGAASASALQDIPASENGERFKATLNAFLVALRKLLIAAAFVTVANRVLHGQGIRTMILLAIQLALPLAFFRKLLKLPQLEALAASLAAIPIFWGALSRFIPPQHMVCTNVHVSARLVVPTSLFQLATAPNPLPKTLAAMRPMSSLGHAKYLAIPIWLFLAFKTLRLLPWTALSWPRQSPMEVESQESTSSDRQNKPEGLGVHSGATTGAEKSKGPRDEVDRSSSSSGAAGKPIPTWMHFFPTETGYVPSPSTFHNFETAISDTGARRRRPASITSSDDWDAFESGEFQLDTDDGPQLSISSSPVRDPAQQEIPPTVDGSRLASADQCSTEKPLISAAGDMRPRMATSEAAARPDALAHGLPQAESDKPESSGKLLTEEHVQEMISEAVRIALLKQSESIEGNGRQLDEIKDLEDRLDLLDSEVLGSSGLRSDLNNLQKECSAIKEQLAEVDSTSSEAANMRDMLQEAEADTLSDFADRVIIAEDSIRALEYKVVSIEEHIEADCATAEDIRELRDSVLSEDDVEAIALRQTEAEVSKARKQLFASYSRDILDLRSRIVAEGEHSKRLTIARAESNAVRAESNAEKLQQLESRFEALADRVQQTDHQVRSFQGQQQWTSGSGPVTAPRLPEDHAAPLEIEWSESTSSATGVKEPRDPSANSLRDGLSTADPPSPEEIQSLKGMPAVKVTTGPTEAEAEHLRGLDVAATNQPTPDKPMIETSPKESERNSPEASEQFKGQKEEEFYIPIEILETPETSPEAVAVAVDETFSRELNRGSENNLFLNREESAASPAVEDMFVEVKLGDSAPAPQTADEKAAKSIENALKITDDSEVSVVIEDAEVPAEKKVAERIEHILSIADDSELKAVMKDLAGAELSTENKAARSIENTLRISDATEVVIPIEDAAQKTSDESDAGHVEVTIEGAQSDANLEYGPSIAPKPKATASKLETLVKEVESKMQTPSKNGSMVTLVNVEYADDKTKRADDSGSEDRGGESGYEDDDESETDVPFGPQAEGGMKTKASTERPWP